jgi:hypothetical protein
VLEGQKRRGHKRVVIDFIGIGGQRCGTTWLYVQLRRHPDVAFPAGKEVHYWNERAEEGAAPWLRMFPQQRDGLVHGDITPAYAILPSSVVCQVHHAAPKARVFLSVRNPMERAWSAALYLLNRCQMDPAEASDEWFIDVVRSWRCRAKSTFSETVIRWDEVFGADQLHVLFYDDIVSQPATVLRDLAVHLHVDEGFYEDGDEALSARQGIITAGRREPSARLRRVLYELHAPEIEDLQILFDRDFGHWFEWGRPSAG